MGFSAIGVHCLPPNGLLCGLTGGQPILVQNPVSARHIIKGLITKKRFSERPECYMCATFLVGEAMSRATNPLLVQPAASSITQATVGFPPSSRDTSSTVLANTRAISFASGRLGSHAGLDGGPTSADASGKRRSALMRLQLCCPRHSIKPSRAKADKCTVLRLCPSNAVLTLAKLAEKSLGAASRWPVSNGAASG